MKKNYITPEINVIQLDTLCAGQFMSASVHRLKLDGECVSTFGIFGEDKTKTEEEYKDLWGESNSGNWGND